jgi:hypothetical protein
MKLTFIEWLRRLSYRNKKVEIKSQYPLTPNECFTSEEYMNDTPDRGITIKEVPKTEEEAMKPFTNPDLPWVKTQEQEKLDEMLKHDPVPDMNKPLGNGIVDHPAFKDNTFGENKMVEAFCERTSLPYVDEMMDKKPPIIETNGVGNVVNSVLSHKKKEISDKLNAAIDDDTRDFFKNFTFGKNGIRPKTSK